MSIEKTHQKSIAKTLYMNGTSLTDISDQIGVSRATLTKWCKEGGWAEQRSAIQLTRPELVNKLLLACSKLLDQLNESDDPSLFTGVADKIAKLSSTIERLDKKATIVDTIEVFIAFGKWLEYRSSTDSEITIDFLKKLNHYQDLYIAENIGK